MKKTITFLLLAICLCVAGCGTLDKGGAYNGDQYLYTADLTITTSYQLFDTFLIWEMQNRAALLKLDPKIKATADDIRANARQWFTTAEALRDAYSANPSSANQSALAKSLSVISTALEQATNYLTKTALPSTAAPAQPPPSSSP